MANYNESNVTGTKWTRSSGGTFGNPYQGMPSIYFSEEEVILLADGTVVKQSIGRPPQGVLGATLSDPTKVFNVLDPSTQAVVGTSTYQEVFNLIHSLYMALATERDIPVVVIPPPVMPMP